MITLRDLLKTTWDVTLLDLDVRHADRKTEPTISKMEQVDKDKPKISCDGCRNFTDGGELCDLCALGEIDNYEPNNFDKYINVRSKDEPQTERSE